MQERERQFKELFHSEYGRMYKAAYILLGDADEANDVVQDIFTQLWAGTTPLREEGRRAFLLTCVRNRCLNIIARHVPLTTGDDKGLNELTLAVSDLQPPDLEKADDEELIDAINSYIDNKLTPQTGRIIKMHYNEQQSYKEISSQLGISPSAVNKHIVQGLRKLRSTFKKQEQ